MKVFILIIISLLIISCIINILLHKEYEKSKEETKRLSKMYAELTEEFQKVIEINKIKKNNKEQADEKINNLHNGNAIANAINILC